MVKRNAAIGAAFALLLVWAAVYTVAFFRMQEDVSLCEERHRDLEEDLGRLEDGVALAEQRSRSDLARVESRLQEIHAWVVTTRELLLRSGPPGQPKEASDEPHSQ